MILHTRHICLSIIILLFISSPCIAEDNAVPNSHSKLTPACLKTINEISASLNNKNFVETIRLGKAFTKSCSHQSPEYASFGYEMEALGEVMSGRYSEALSSSNKCISISHDNASCYVHKGASLIYLNDRKGAEATFKKAKTLCNNGIRKCFQELESNKDETESAILSSKISNYKVTLNEITILEAAVNNVHKEQSNKGQKKK